MNWLMLIFVIVSGILETNSKLWIELDLVMNFLI